MSFVALQEALRKELRKRVDAGGLTGVELARRTGFTQAHISNFLNRKRGLKLAALDRALKAIGLSLYDLLNPHELARFAAVPVAGADAQEVEVPVVSPETAVGREVAVRDETRAMARYARTMLERIRPDLAVPSRRSWTRFVALEASSRDAASMAPRFGAGALLLVDRHYTTLHPYRKGQRNVYAVCREESCIVRYVEAADDSLILRPHRAEAPVEIVTFVAGQSPGSVLVGRVAHIATEL
jgi:transcriptional regulator with XRE-family HTH domain